MKRLLSILLTATFVIVLIAITLPGASAASEPIIVVAGSDFQDKTSHEVGKERLDGFFSAMKSDGITNIDGFLFAGDYDYDSYGNTVETTNGVEAVKSSVSTLSPEHSVFAQGNHDASVGTCGMSPSGANDHPDGLYGAFVINEDDFTWNGQDESTVKHTAQNLVNYLNAKLKAGYNKPIFIVSHLPIHYNYRTKNNGDGIYGNYIFNALNEAGEKGLNIIFMYGHNHSSGWDNFLGGSAVFLTKGDKLNIPQGSKTVFKEETLNFTYMNAGYVSYYTEGGSAEDTLTMSVFKFTSDSLEIIRYDVNGAYQYLKAEGSTDVLNETDYSADKKTYSSHYTVALTSVSDQTAIEDVIKQAKPLEGRNYKKVVSLDELEDGGIYLLIHNQYGEKLMIPNFVTKSNSSGSRTGFDFEDASAFSDEIVAGDLFEKEWTLKKTDSGWLLQSGDKYVAFTQKSDHISATLEDIGTFFNVSGSINNFVFTADLNGNTVGFNYNSRGVINGYKDGAESFTIYKLIGYTVEVENGTAFVDGNEADVVLPGETVTLRANDAPAGKIFDKWIVNDGEISVSENGTFTMPSASVKISASYSDSQSTQTPGDTNVGLPEDTNTDSTEDADPDSPDETVIAFTVILIAIIGISTTVVCRKNRKSKQ